MKLQDQSQRGRLSTLTLTLRQGPNRGVDAWISSSFSEIKLAAPSSCSIFLGKNKCLYQGAFLGGEDEAGENIPFCAPVASPGATEPTSWLPGVGIPFPGGLLLLWSLL